MTHAVEPSRAVARQRSPEADDVDLAVLQRLNRSERVGDEADRDLFDVRACCHPCTPVGVERDVLVGHVVADHVRAAGDDEIEVFRHLGEVEAGVPATYEMGARAASSSSGWRRALPPSPLRVLDLEGLLGDDVSGQHLTHVANVSSQSTNGSSYVSVMDVRHR